jgi:hypothetical protein
MLLRKSSLSLTLFCVSLAALTAPCFSENPQKSPLYAVAKGNVSSIAQTKNGEAPAVEEKRRIVIKVPEADQGLLNHKGLLSGYQAYLEKKYDVVYTTDLDEAADIFVVKNYTRDFGHWQTYFKDLYTWFFGQRKNSVTPESICRDSAPVKILYAHETWTSFPEGFDDCFDFMIGYDYKIEHPRYMTIPGLAYEFYQDKISTDYQSSNDMWRAKGCQPQERKYDVCLLTSNAGKKDRMEDLAHERLALYHALAKQTHTASGGKLENNIGYVVPRGEELDWMMNCRFVISYENRVYPGYITEKPYQAWLAGAVPIYAGHRSTLGNINRDAIIFAPDYDDNAQIVDKITALLSDREAYCALWSQSLHTDPDKNYGVLKETVSRKLIEISEDRLEDTA